MSVIPGRRLNLLSRWLVYIAALLVAAATTLVLRAAEPDPGALSGPPVFSPPAG